MAAVEIRELEAAIKQLKVEARQRELEVEELKNRSAKIEEII